jgi:asparagine synthase (glutamine-hydrolysing)
MCGIFGSANGSGIRLLKSSDSLQTLKHRGPDQQGEFVDDMVYMGHRRLSILDLSENGKQPMVSSEAVITVNGEIYNFQELKRELQGKYKFKSKSDSEVILHGYSEWGIDGLLDRIDGMYSFAVYDKKKKFVYLVRDRYGIKPLYYSFHNNSFVWASELKAIEKYYDQAKLSIDYSAIYDYLTYLYIPAPKTLFKNVFKLEPAHYLVIDLNKLDFLVKKYWTLPSQEIKIDIVSAASKIRELINESVKSQMISDVPLGFFLSGGIDSSIVVATATQYSKQLHTYSIGFDISSHNETQYSRQIAGLFNTDHNEKILDVESANRLFRHMKLWYDEPFADTSAIPTYLVSEFAKRNSTVVLTGDGGDELFGGYDWYERYFEYSKKHIFCPDSLQVLCSGIKKRNRYSLIGRIANQLEYRMLGGYKLYSKLLGGLLPNGKLKYKNAWNIPDDYDDFWYFKKFYKPELNPKKRFQYLDFHTYLPDDIFTKVDRVSMSVALECRIPFMNRELVEFAFSLPEDIIYYNNQKKGLLKYAYNEILPENILYRKKRGFNIPLSEWNNQFLKNVPTQQERILSLFNLNV